MTHARADSTRSRHRRALFISAVSDLLFPSDANSVRDVAGWIDSLVAGVDTAPGRLAVAEAEARDAEVLAARVSALVTLTSEARP